jgi:hypothetical protein
MNSTRYTPIALPFYVVNPAWNNEQEDFAMFGKGRRATRWTVGGVYEYQGSSKIQWLSKEPAIGTRFVCVGVEGCVGELENRETDETIFCSGPEAFTWVDQY